MKEVYCINCGVMRIDEPDPILTEQECKKTTKKVCPVCSCPYVEEISKREGVEK